MKTNNKVALILLFIIATIFIGGCSNEKNVKVTESIVRFYGWGGDKNVNAYIDDYIAPLVKEKHNIKLVRVPMNIDEILMKLTNEKEVDSESGDIDIMWINGENFATAKNLDLLSKPFTNEIANYEKNLDKNDKILKYDFNTPIDGLEVPWGVANFVLMGDSEKLEYLPGNYMELLELAKNNKGAFTYPAPPDFTGSAFVRLIIRDILGNVELSENKDEMAIELQPVFDYLNELEKYLWTEGESYPKEESIMQRMYSDGQIFMTMSYTALFGERKKAEGEFTKSTETFIFDNGTLGNAHYLAKPFNAPNSEGANLVINELISAEAQNKKLEIPGWGDLPSISMNNLGNDDINLFKNNPSFNLIENERKLVEEFTVKQIAIIEELWEEMVLKN